MRGVSGFSAHICCGEWHSQCITYCDANRQRCPLVLYVSALLWNAVHNNNVTKVLVAISYIHARVLISMGRKNKTQPTLVDVFRHAPDNFGWGPSKVKCFRLVQMWAGSSGRVVNGQSYYCYFHAHSQRRGRHKFNTAPH